jgi:hypothetical protein
MSVVENTCGCPMSDLLASGLDWNSGWFSLWWLECTRRDNKICNRMNCWIDGWRVDALKLVWIVVIVILGF